MGVLALLASACGSSAPTGPGPAPVVMTSAAAQMTGTWSGLAEVTACNDSQFGHCDYVEPFNGFTFTLSKADGGWSGTVELEEPSRAVVAVQGIEDAEGRRVTFSGATTPSSANGWMATVTSLRLEPDVASGLSGTLSYAYRHAGSAGRVITMTGRIGSAARGPRLPREFSPVDVDGTWLVSTLVESCAHWQGGPCAGQYPDPSTMTLAIRGSTTASPHAVAVFPGNVVAELSGARDADGSVRFSGSGTSPWSSFFRVDVPELVIRADAAQGLTGRFVYARQHSASRNNPAGTMSIAGTIPSATRQDLEFSPGRFHGSWSGDVIIDACLVGDCTPIGVGGTRDLRLALTQSGSSVAGSFQLLGLAVPLSGSAAQSAVQLSGDGVPTGCHELSMYLQQCEQHVRNANLVLDDFGRVTGTIDYSAKGISGATPYSYTVRLVLVAVVPEL